MITFWSIRIFMERSVITGPVVRSASSRTLFSLIRITSSISKSSRRTSSIPWSASVSRSTPTILISWSRISVVRSASRSWIATRARSKRSSSTTVGWGIWSLNLYTTLRNLLRRTTPMSFLPHLTRSFTITGSKLNLHSSTANIFSIHGFQGIFSFFNMLKCIKKS